MNLETKIKTFLENKKLYDENTFQYVLSKIKNQNQTDEELESQIMQIIFDKTKRTFSDQADGYKSNNEKFEETLRIFNPDYEYTPKPQPEIYDDSQTQVGNNSQTKVNDDFNEILKFIAENPETVKTSYNNFVSRSVYQDEKKEERRTEIKKKAAMFVAHIVVFAGLSLIRANFDPDALRAGTTHALFIESFLKMNAFYGGIELYLFLKKCFNFDNDYNKRRY